MKYSQAKANSPMSIETNDSSKMQGLANKVADGNCEILANSMNDFCVSVSEHLPRLNVDNEVFTGEGELPDECSKYTNHL